MEGFTKTRRENVKGTLSWISKAAFPNFKITRNEYASNSSLDGSVVIFGRDAIKLRPISKALQ